MRLDKRKARAKQKAKLLNFERGQVIRAKKADRANAQLKEAILLDEYNKTQGER